MGTEGLEWALYYITTCAFGFGFCPVLMETGGPFLLLFGSSLGGGGALWSS